MEWNARAFGREAYGYGAGHTCQHLATSSVSDTRGKRSASMHNMRNLSMQNVGGNAIHFIVLHIINNIFPSW